MKALTSILLVGLILAILLVSVISMLDKFGIAP